LNLRTRLITLVTRLLRPLGGNAAGTRPAARRIVLIKPCCLGDVLLSTPLLAALREGYPDARITYAVGSWSRPMVEHSAHVDEILELPDRWTPGSLVAVVRALRLRGYDLAVVPDRSPLLSLLAWTAAIPARAGLDSLGRGFAYTHRAPVPALVEHEADVYNRLAAALALPEPQRRLYFFPTTAAGERAVELERQVAGAGPLVALHPGGGSNPGMRLPRKRWLPERWARVADSLAERGARVLVLGGPGDEAAVEAMIGAMQRPATTLVQRWSWDDLGALLRRCALFGGHDTGMMHLAVAVGTPVVAVFGPSDPQLYGPYGSGIAVWRPTPQSPCFYNGEVDPECPCAGQCMRTIEAEDVLAAVERLGALAAARSD
jgi:lipopolysaccharide heptosyltransferase II